MTSFQDGKKSKKVLNYQNLFKQPGRGKLSNQVVVGFKALITFLIFEPMIT